MEINELYNLAKQYADMIMQSKPEYISESDSAVCVIVDKDEQPITGVTTVTVKGGQVETVPAETVAVRRFIDSADSTAAKKIVTLLFKDGSVVNTGKASLMILAQANPANGDCCVLTSPEEGTLLREIVPVPEAAPVVEKAPEVKAAAEPSMMDLMDGFDVDTDTEEKSAADKKAVNAAESVGAPAEFADGFSVDESNPFFEASAPANGAAAVNTIDNGGVKTMFDHPSDATAQGAAGFNIPPTMQQGYPRQGMQSGYPQQGMGYPQQGVQSGYPQQGMGYPQQGMQSGYPQQGMGYPQQGMQGGYPQQGMGYPQQGMQGGYPQQGMGYPQQGMQGGYPQQGMGYPQQGMQGGYPQQGMGFQQQPMQNGFQGAGTTVRPAVNNGGVVSTMMKMPGVGQTSIQVGDISSRQAVSQSIKSISTDELRRPSTFASTIDDDDEDEEEVPMTLDEMRKLAKQKKKNAKVNSNFKKKMRDSGF